MADASDDKPTDRRGFFRESLASMLGPLANLVQGRLDRVRRSIETAAPRPRLLRPPGALLEAEFLRTCQSCGKCASACPVSAIRMRRDTRPARAGAPKLAEVTPVICAIEQPCVLCESLPCMQACPSGALVRTPVEKIHMGTAECTPQLCLRTQGEDCTACIDSCPRGTDAIALGEQPDMATRAPVVLNYSGCVGCGLCEHRCPTSPHAIIVQPIR
ncbi:MAG: 4Fe-4S dicluster domain-containing protein [Phycisphaerae bacterium]|nr:4Fe-4S dicluster domain-containing protein [Phycisphaerae bacterium]